MCVRERDESQNLVSLLHCSSSSQSSSSRARKKERAGRQGEQFSNVNIGLDGCVSLLSQQSLLLPFRRLPSDPGLLLLLIPQIEPLEKKTKSLCKRYDFLTVSWNAFSQGCVICLLLALGWLMAAYVRYFLKLLSSASVFFISQNVCFFLFYRRNREVKRIKNSVKAGNSFAFLYQDMDELEHSRQAKLPRVSVIMPLKGFGEHNLHNWRSQV